MGKGGQKATPEASEMKAAWKLFEGGDKVAARREAARILKGAPSEGDKQQAAELLDRTGFPKMGLLLAATAAALILLMVALALVRAN